MKTKLTTCERRAESFCRSLVHNSGGTVQIEWKRSRMWGHNPVISYHAVHATSGCGASRTMDELEKRGWIMCKVAGTSTFDAYELSLPAMEKNEV